MISPPVSSTSAAARDSSFTPVRDESDPAAMLYELQLFSDATKKVVFDGSLGLLTTTTISGTNTRFPILRKCVSVVYSVLNAKTRQNRVCFFLEILMKK